MELTRRMLRLLLWVAVTAAFLGAMYGLVVLWFHQMDPYG